MKLPFHNTYASLPPSFYEKVGLRPVLQPFLIVANDGLARELGIDPDDLHSPEGVAVLAGNAVPEGAEPIATAYAWHQFGNFTPLLGDGRALLLGEIAGKDIQLKGSGPTPFSRRGDGRSALGPVLREYLVSEAMHALGVPTTRSLAAVGTGEMVLREEPQKGGILTRVASSHLRVGTVQYFAGRRDRESLDALVRYAGERLFSGTIGALELLREVMVRQADLIAQWMGVGFIHGVMNTDNMSLSGETIDYGPCAFMDHYDPAQKYSYIDQGGRYSYRNQPGIAQWNLVRLAEALLPLIDDQEDRAVEQAKAVLEEFPERYEKARLALFSRKLGHREPLKPELVQSLLDLMASQEADFTNTFRSLAGSREEFLSHFQDDSPARAWWDQWKGAGEPEVALMDSMNPAVIPRNHRIEEVIEAAQKDDFEPFHNLHRVLARPYQVGRDDREYTRPPALDEVVCATFCGT
jgi:uncharacterized protein YdiU (UPF0061 family)